MEPERKRKRANPPEGQPSSGNNRPIKRSKRVPPLSSDAVKKAVQERLKSIHRDLRENSKDRKITRAAKSKDPALKGVRNLDRLAWVIAHLHDDRGCVAVYVDSDAGKLRVWANNADAGLKGDVSRLIKAAAGDGTALNDLKAKLAGSQLDVRIGKPDPTRQRRAQTRLTTAIEFLNEIGTVRASAPTVEYAFEGDVHAEQLAADYLLQAKPSRPPRLGISKLCCFLCWRALVALRESGKLNVRVTDTHLKVYENWPVPDFLRDEKVLLLFFEVDDDDDADDQRLARAIRENKDDVLAAIRSLSSVTGYADTAYYSSGDEADDAKAKPDGTESNTTTTTSNQYWEDEEPEEEEEESSSSDHEIEMEEDELEATSDSDNSDDDPTWRPGGR